MWISILAIVIAVSIACSVTAVFYGREQQSDAWKAIH